MHLQCELQVERVEVERAPGKGQRTLCITKDKGPASQSGDRTLRDIAGADGPDERSLALECTDCQGVKAQGFLSSGHSSKALLELFSSCSAMMNLRIQRSQTALWETWSG